MTQEEINKLIRWEVKEIPKTGGQTVGVLKSSPQILICDDLNIKIEIGYYRNAFKNRELALQLFELAVMEFQS